MLGQGKHLLKLYLVQRFPGFLLAGLVTIYIHIIYSDIIGPGLFSVTKGAREEDVWQCRDEPQATLPKST